MKNIVLALVALTSLLPLSASAKPYHLTHVAWIVANRNNLDVDDHYVTLVGHATRRIGGESYWFADSTGQIRLDSENFDLPIGRTIVVGGRIDEAYLGFGHIEVDVRNWHYPVAPRHAAPKAATTTPASAPAPTHAATSESTASTTSPSAPAPVVSTPEKPASSLAPAPEPAPAPVTASVPATSSAAAAAATAAPEASTNSVATPAPAPAPEPSTNAAPVPASTNTP